MTSEDPRNPPDDARRADVERARRVWDALGAYPDEPVPAGFSARVMARVRGEAHASDASSTTSDAARAPSDASRGPSLRFLAGGRLRGLAIAASLVASLGAGVLLSQRFLVREAVSVPAPTAALEAVPAELLDNEGLVTLASLPDADFEALLLSELADAEAQDSK